MNVNLDELKKLCGCGQKHDIFVKYVFIEENAIDKLDFIIKDLRLAGKGAIVCDENTFEAAGKKVLKTLEKTYNSCYTIALNSKNLHADEKAVKSIKDALQGNTGYLLAVGSGTIHDAVRYVAKEMNMNFISIPTAASVDGFVSTVAAMTWDGFKVTFPAKSPIAVLADTNIFANAPYRLTAAGVGDLLGKYTALADWRISNLVTGEFLCENIYNMMNNAMHKCVDIIDEIYNAQPEAIEKLMYALLLSGLAMQMMGNSRPASGSEHHVSHLWEMAVINPDIDALHGEKVGVGLTLICEEYARIKDSDMKIISWNGMPEKLLEDSFGTLYDGVKKENKSDLISNINLDVLEEKKREIRKILSDLPSKLEICNMLKAAGAKSSLSEIGLSPDITDLTLKVSPFVRNRLTMMRLNWLFQD